MEIWSSVRKIKNTIRRIVNGRMVQSLIIEEIKNRRVIKENCRWRKEYPRKEEVTLRNEKWKKEVSNRIIFKIINRNSGLETQWITRSKQTLWIKKSREIFSH